MLVVHLSILILQLCSLSDVMFPNLRDGANRESDKRDRSVRGREVFLRRGERENEKEKEKDHVRDGKKNHKRTYLGSNTEYFHFDGLFCVNTYDDNTCVSIVFLN